MDAANGGANRSASKVGVGAEIGAQADVANPFEGGARVDRERLFALRTCAEYLAGSLVGRISLTDLLTATGIKRDAYNNLWRAQSPDASLVAGTKARQGVR
jgi:hypothetical protein